MVKSLIAGALLLLAVPAQAVTIMDASKAKLAWTWAQGTGGAVERFIVRCGVQTGVYTATKQIIDPNARSTPLLPFVGANGQYFCVIDASNFAGVATSAELNFSLIQAVVVASAPTAVTVIP